MKEMSSVKMASNTMRPLNVTSKSSTTGITGYISRTQAVSKAAETRSPRVIRAGLANTNSGFNKREMSRAKQLEPIKINEQITAENEEAKVAQKEGQQPAADCDKNLCNNPLSGSKQHRNSSVASNGTTLQPLNHTPTIVKKSQHPLISTSKTFYQEQQMSVQNTAKQHSDLRRTQHLLS